MPLELAAPLWMSLLPHAGGLGLAPHAGGLGLAPHAGGLMHHAGSPATPAIIRPADARLLAPGYLPASREERRKAVADLLRSRRLTREQAANALVVKLPPAMAMLTVNQLMGFGAGDPGPAATITYLGDNRAGGGSSATWTSVTLGTSYDHFIAYFHYSDGPGGDRSFVSASLAGSAMTEVIQSHAAYSGVAIYIIQLGAASGDLVVTLSASVSLGGGAPYPFYYALFGVRNLISKTKISASAYAGGASPWPVTVNSDPLGVVVGGWGQYGEGTLSLSGTWTTSDLSASRIGYQSASATMAIGKASQGLSRASLSFASTTSGSGPASVAAAFR